MTATTLLLFFAIVFFVLAIAIRAIPRKQPHPDQLAKMIQEAARNL